MCGIVGLYTVDSDPSIIIQSMLDSLSHRGPDSNGYEVFNSLVLGHTRLSIQDLSSAGNQPMTSHDGRFVIVFNGEIYNHMDLRLSKLANVSWRGSSDTETLLELISKYSLKETLGLIRGMYAFAVYDTKLNLISIARDRYGEKPLYYTSQNGMFVFASELKPIRLCPNLQLEIDNNSFHDFLTYGCIQQPSSIFKNLHQLSPGAFAVIDLNNLSKEIVEQVYWSPGRLESQIMNYREDQYHDAVDDFERIFFEVVEEQLVSDVGVGAFLSGGIDSTAVVVALKNISSNPISTFTIGFKDKRYDESVYAKNIAQHLNTNHNELILDTDKVIQTINNMGNIYSEPFADSSQLATHLVCSLARSDVTVALSGDGGDEMFGGYNRHVSAASWLGPVFNIPLKLRRLLSTMAFSISPSSYDRYFSIFSQVAPRILQMRTPGDKVHKLAGVLDSNNLSSLYESLLKINSEAHKLIAIERKGVYSNSISSEINDFRAMMIEDAKRYLCNDILVKVDRAGMSNSLETRMPFLDPRIFEFSQSLPDSFLVKNRKGKRLLTDFLSSHVPKSLFERPKMGFGLPIDTWLRDELREWSESLLDYNRLKQDGYFDAEEVRRVWSLHLSGKYNLSHRLWPVLMFQSWLESY